MLGSGSCSSLGQERRVRGLISAKVLVMALLCNPLICMTGL